MNARCSIASIKLESAARIAPGYSQSAFLRFPRKFTEGAVAPISSAPTYLLTAALTFSTANAVIASQSSSFFQSQASLLPALSRRETASV